MLRVEGRVAASGLVVNPNLKLLKVLGFRLTRQERVKRDIKAFHKILSTSFTS